MKNKLYDISWQVNEETYRKDPALSYSTLAKYERSGFDGLKDLFERQESPSLTFGSAVDAIITGGEEEFNKNFIVATSKVPSESDTKIIKALFNTYGTVYESILQIPVTDVVTMTEAMNYNLRWKDITRVKHIRETGEEYYKMLGLSKGKQVLDMLVYNDVRAAVRALKESNNTKDYFAANTPFNEELQREYQLKFKGKINGVTYRCMADLLFTNFTTKTVYPIDLKTSGHPEWAFYDSFIKWGYQIQARLYHKLIKMRMSEDNFWKDFTLAPYRFIVVNRNTLTPLVWTFEDTEKEGTLYYGQNKQIILRDPIEIGAELDMYLRENPKVPLGISEFEDNSLTEFLNKKR